MRSHIDSSLIRVDYAMMSVRGGKQKTNQDSCFVSVNLAKPHRGSRGILAVCDGHGPAGHDVCASAVQMLAAQAAEDTEVELAAMVQQAEDGLRMDHHTVSMNSGTTCCMVELRPSSIKCANVGDSRAILIAKGVNIDEMTMQEMCVPLSQDHNCEHKGERLRLSSVGIHPDKYGRYWIKSRGVGWNFTRSVGDFIGKEQLLSPQAEVEEIEFEGNFEEGAYLVVASDGLWEFVSNEMVVEKIYSHRPEDVNKMCKELAQMARHAWRTNEENYCDDVTIIVAKIDRFDEFQLL